MPHKYPFTAEGYHNARQHYLRTGNFVPYSLGYSGNKMPPATSRPSKTGRSANSNSYAKSISKARPGRAPMLSDAEMNWAYDQGMKKASTMALQRSARFGNELRGIDTLLNISGGIINTTNTNGGAFMLNGTNQGSASWQRIGNKIAMQSLRLRGKLTTTYTPIVTTAATAAQTVRMVVVYDKTPAGSLPAWDTIFGTITNEGGVASSILASLLLVRTKRFRVLKDCVWSFSPTAGGSGGTTNVTQIDHCFDEFVPLKNLETQYTASNTTPVIGDISSGGLYVFFRASDDSASATRTVVEDSSARLRFQP